MKYKFYFDETWHDRKIVFNKDGKLDILEEKTKFDDYIGVFYGYKNKDIKLLKSKFYKLEEKYKKRFCVKEEFKSNSISCNKYKYGVKSFKKNDFDFYFDFFSLLNNTTPIIHIFVFNKIEYVFRKIIKFKYNDPTKEAFFFYSIAKFYLIYNTKELNNSMYLSFQNQNIDIFAKKLISRLNEVILNIENLPRKNVEVIEFKILKEIITNHIEWKTDELNYKYDFIYIQNFYGLCSLLKELSIKQSNVSLTIDYEINTSKSVKDFDFQKIKYANSIDVIEVRMCDFLCGFIGKMFYQLKRNILNQDADCIRKWDKENLNKIKLLPKEWFNLKEEHFNLYIMVYNVLIKKQQSYCSTLSLSFGDSAILFYSFIGYVKSYENFKQFKDVSPEEHSRRYNEHLVRKMSQYFFRIYEQNELLKYSKNLKYNR